MAFHAHGDQDIKVDASRRVSVSGSDEVFVNGCRRVIVSHSDIDRIDGSVIKAAYGNHVDTASIDVPKRSEFNDLSRMMLTDAENLTKLVKIVDQLTDRIKAIETVLEDQALQSAWEENRANGV